MKRIALLLFLALPLAAADFEAGVRHVVVKTLGDSGELELPLSRGFAATGEVFWSKRVSTMLAASFVNPEAILRNEVDLGTLGLDVYSLTARWHVAPDARLSGFAGAGPAIVRIGNLDDQFGDVYEADFDNETTLALDGGLRYRLTPRVALELDVLYLPLDAKPIVRKATDPNVQLEETLGIDPLIVSVGASWRFGGR